MSGSKKTLFEQFYSVPFYDYTKIPRRKTPPNYTLTFSYSEASGVTRKHAEQVLKTSQNLADVFSSRQLPETFLGRRVINGDHHDLRFLDPQGVVIGLSAKGPARYDTASGFVVQTRPEKPITQELYVF